MRLIALLSSCLALAALASAPESGAATAAPCRRAAVPTASTTVQISEVEADPVLSGTDTANEWLELANVGALPVTLTNWTLADSAATDPLPTLTLGAGRCVVIAASSTGFLAEHVGYAQQFRVVADGAIGNGLGNGGDLLSLRDGNGLEVDCVVWGSGTGCFSPAAAATAANTSATLQRTSGVDTDAAADWAAAAETPCSLTTAVRAASFRAAAVGRQAVRLTWRLAPGADVLGFNVWRGGRRANQRLIGVHARLAYRFLDRVAPAARPLRYRLQVLLPDGRSEWLGPVVIRAARAA